MGVALWACSVGLGVVLSNSGCGFRRVGACLFDKA